MRRLAVSLWLLVAACSTSTAPVDAHAATMTQDAFVEACSDTTDPRSVDFFGETCQVGPADANATCHASDTGWCIDGVCRPMCSAGCPRCSGGAAQIAAAGACYCVPRS